MKNVTLECSVLYVKDFVRMREFYSDMLQAQPINADWKDTWAVFVAGGTKFALHAIPPVQAEAIDISSPPATRESVPLKLVFAVDDVPAERARLEGVGATALLRSMQEAGQSCDFVDPEGNVFQIAARIRLPHLFGIDTR
jgi:catechol 2,3-dioxygenase-like lactoylglutathione lyase family enzyme